MLINAYLKQTYNVEIQCGGIYINSSTPKHLYFSHLTVFAILLYNNVFQPIGCSDGCSISLLQSFYCIKE